MMAPDPLSGGKLWSVILAGGNGSRMASFIQRWRGHAIPKQYCSFFGSQTLLQQTVARAGSLTDHSRIVAVVSESYQHTASSQLGDSSHVHILAEPYSRGTGPALYLALAFIRSLDRYARVVIFPSDHFAHPEEFMINGIDYACWLVDRFAERLVILGVRPLCDEPESGLVCPTFGRQMSNLYPLCSIHAYREQPSVQYVGRNRDLGVLWNTQIVLGRLEILWTLGWHWFPDVMALLGRMPDIRNFAHEREVLEPLYRKLSFYDFSADCLAITPSLFTCLEIQKVLWCDWNLPEQVTWTLHQAGIQPNYPLALTGGLTERSPVS